VLVTVCSINARKSAIYKAQTFHSHCGRLALPNGEINTKFPTWESQALAKEIWRQEKYCWQAVTDQQACSMVAHACHHKNFVFAIFLKNTQKNVSKTKNVTFISKTFSFRKCFLN